MIGSISCTGLNCSFTDASSDPNGSETIEHWSWVFGDGTPPVDVQGPSHTYAAAGDYVVTLTVTDAGGLSNSDQKPLTVQTGTATGATTRQGTPTSLHS
jgi:PKD repeat protein